MSSSEWVSFFVSTVLPVLVVTIPVVGNLLIIALRSRGYHGAADWVGRMTPFAIALASSKNREQAIKVIVEHVAQQPAVPPTVAVAAAIASSRVPATAAKEPPDGGSAGPTIPSGPPDGMPDPKDVTPIPRVAVSDVTWDDREDTKVDVFAWARFAPVALILCAGCTPAQWQEAKSGIGAGLKIAGALCERTQEVTDEGWVDFACRVVNAGSDVLSNMSTDARMDTSIMTGGSSVIVVQVRAEDAEQFAREHGRP